MKDSPTPLPTKVTLADILEKIEATSYTVLPNTTTTVCQLRMRNGYTVIGTSSCVDPNEFSVAVGEKFAFEDAIDKAWPLEGYLLAERRYQAMKGQA